MIGMWNTAICNVELGIWNVEFCIPKSAFRILK